MKLYWRYKKRGKWTWKAARTKQWGTYLRVEAEEEE